MSPGRPTLAAVGEFGLLGRLLPTLPSGAGVVVGPGDDCAVVRGSARRLLVTVDALVENVHFRRGWLAPEQLGRKAFLVNASDVAAMGGTPRWCVVNISAPAMTPASTVAAISRGVAAAARHNDAALVGGNLSRGAELTVTVALIGEAPRRPVLRRGARPGDRLYVTGRLGDAALGLRQLRRDPAARTPAVRRFREPPSRWRAGAQLARSGAASAMIDVSDGLVQDLGHLCTASGVGARLCLDLLPCSREVRQAGIRLALTGGEDYELLCAVPARHRRRVENLAARLGCSFTAIGECTARRREIEIVDADGRSVPLTQVGHDHFAGRSRR